MIGAWKVITRPMLIDSQRPEYCGAGDEETQDCPVCPATFGGNDVVKGVCQAIRNGRVARPLVELVVVHKHPAQPKAENPHD